MFNMLLFVPLPNLTAGRQSQWKQERCLIRRQLSGSYVSDARSHIIAELSLLKGDTGLIVAYNLLFRYYNNNNGRKFGTSRNDEVAHKQKITSEIKGIRSFGTR